MAEKLGHDLHKGKIKKISTGNGVANAFQHSFIITIFHPEKPGNKIIHTIDNVLIDCMPNLPIVLLGVSSFLSGFKLIIDYPENKFSLTRKEDPKDGDKKSPRQ